MNDCIWYAIQVCGDCCKCEKYLSVNTDEGYEIEEKWTLKVEEVLAAIALEFAKENGFK